MIMNVINKGCVFEDERGKIIDIIEKEDIEYVTLISSKKGAIRGNHFHKKSVQYTYVLNGSFELYTKIGDEETKKTIIKSGDLALTPAMEKHTLLALEDSEFLVFTRGPRGGEDYETDTYRLTDGDELTAND